MPTIVLGQDEVDCFSAWVSIEAGLPECSEPQSEIKVNPFYIMILMVYITKFFFILDKLW